MQKSTHFQFWQEWLRNFLYSRSVREPMMIIKEWSQRDHPFNRKFKPARGMTDWTDLYRKNLRFGSSEDFLGIQIADISANICYRYYSGSPKYRPYRLLRSRISGRGRHNSEIHYGVLNESSLLTGSAEKQVKDYTEEEVAAMEEISQSKTRGQRMKWKVGQWR